MTKLSKLIDGCIKNDRASQEEFFKSYYPRLMVVSLRMSPDDDTAKDLLQDAFLKIFDKLHTLDNRLPAVVYSWCCRIVSNTVIDYIRKNKNTYSVDTLEETLEETLESADEGIEYGYLDSKGIEPHMLISAMQNLSPQYRLVFNLYVIDGLTHKAIGERLGISEGTSKSNLFKARKNVKKELELVCK
jgi:RNA polymerase sigma-70 factor (ECF subfamily)